MFCAWLLLNIVFDVVPRPKSGFASTLGWDCSGIHACRRFSKAPAFDPKILRIGGKSSMSGATLGCPALQVPMPPEAPTFSNVVFKKAILWKVVLDVAGKMEKHPNGFIFTMVNKVWSTMGWNLGYRRIPHFIIFIQPTPLLVWSRKGSVDKHEWLFALWFTCRLHAWDVCFLGSWQVCRKFWSCGLGTGMCLLSLVALSDHGYLIMYLSTRWKK